MSENCFIPLQFTDPRDPRKGEDCGIRPAISRNSTKNQKTVDRAVWNTLQSSNG
jgi:hypothetical protein